MRETYVAMAALSGLPGMNFTSWMPSPWKKVHQPEFRDPRRKGTHVRDGDGRNDRPVRQVPQSQGAGLLNTQGRLEDRDGNNKVRGQDDALIEVNSQTVGAELLAENVQRASNILRPLVNDISLGVRLDETTR